MAVATPEDGDFAIHGSGVANMRDNQGISMKSFLLAGVIAVATASTGFADALQRISDTGLIRLGVRADAPPFSYHDPGGAPAGLAVALCNRVVDLLAQQIGRTSLAIEYITVRADERFPALIDERTDLHCGPASATLSRRESLDFSLLYFVDGAAAAITPGKYETVFDDRSGTFGYVAGTTTEAVVRDLVKRNGLDADLVSFPSHGDGLDALADGSVDMYFGDQAILLFQISDRGLTDQVIVMEEIFSFEPYALVMKRGESGLRLMVDRALSMIYDQGIIYKLILDELGTFPLPPETRALYQIVGLPE